MAYAEAERIDPGEIPVIALDGAVSLDHVGRAILAAAEGIGFFYISDHGIPDTLMADVFRVARAFFAEPVERKRMVAPAGPHRGFIEMGGAKMASGARPDRKESFVWGLDEPGPDGIPANRWPAFPPETRDVLMTYFARGHTVGWTLMRAFAVAMGVAPDTFLRTVSRPVSRGSILYYPPQPPEMGTEQFGVSEHTDYGVLTLLWQDDTGGLQVLGRDGRWLEAAPVPGTFVVNVGDLLARWSNDRFRSTLHRVVNRSGRARMSTALFIDPDRDTVIEPVARDGEAPRYPAVTCGDYLRSRFDAAFAYRQKAGA